MDALEPIKRLFTGEDASSEVDYDSYMFEVKRGMAVTGTVGYVDRSEVLVEFNGPVDGFITRREWYLYEQNPEEWPKVGDSVSAVIIDLEDDEEKMRLSRKQYLLRNRWAELEEAHEQGSVIKGQVTGAVKGGLVIDLGLRAFMPISQISEDRDSVVTEEWVGKEIDCKVLSLNKRRYNIVLSHKATLEQTEKPELPTA